jgi:Antibiotic biosynthesis monooxygenase
MDIKNFCALREYDGLTIMKSPLVPLLLMLLKFVSPARSFVSRSSYLLSTRGGTSAFSSTSQMASSSKPFAVVVQAEIKPDRMEEFLEMIKNNAENSRKEPGCIRFGKDTIDGF